MQQDGAKTKAIFKIAGGRRTPQVGRRVLSARPASIGRRLCSLLVCCALLLGCDDTTSAPETSKHDTGRQTGVIREAIDDGLADRADSITPEIPVVNANTLKALKRQAAIQKKALVVGCWATWCPSCVAMFPHLHKAMKQRGEDVVLISLNFDQGEKLTAKAGDFLTKQDAWHNAYQAEEGSEARDELVKVLGDTWDGGTLPAVFVYGPNGSVILEFTETRGELQDWVKEITDAVDAALPVAGNRPRL